MSSLVRYRILPWRRSFSQSVRLREIKSISELPNRTLPQYRETNNHGLLSLQWPSPPRNVLLTKKNNTPAITDSLVEYANHIHSTYPSMNLILEPHAAEEVHSQLAFPVFTTTEPASTTSPTTVSDKTDLISTLGGDGTILHASSLFAHTRSVPPILTFGMGTLGFLGEWKFKEYKRAFREVYMSGASDAYASTTSPLTSTSPSPPYPTTPSYSAIRGKAMGKTRNARILFRNRLRVGVFSPTGTRINTPTPTTTGDTYALNEVIVHRGSSPHLKIISVYVNGRFLTEAVADGMIISSPTGSTAYSLSSGGSIVHPLVPSLLLTPICPRSLSFRPLVLPANTPITLRLSEKNRGREVEVSIDGVRISSGVGVGMEVRVLGEEMRDRLSGEWCGGVPSIVRGVVGTEEKEEDHWVGGLNALLKFNYPFGEEA
ncbi:ATP-NAD kinase [Lepidopterella palustris CBS 459.81]|uniref:ATP-NAD kinase n=1 Tax=Lepidopterella palustris CBS 459.81 TaxID=1314670 RepID=A0A8E2E4J6_9PEZI|nr:ATP-NAD kinase [Lepidopterella palustris CBS 459.81]